MKAVDISAKDVEEACDLQAQFTRVGEDESLRATHGGGEKLLEKRYVGSRRYGGGCLREGDKEVESFKQKRYQLFLYGDGRVKAHIG